MAITHKVDERRVRTTITLPVSMLQAIDALIKHGNGKVSSRAEFLEKALREHIALAERQRIDGAFSAMANDPAYQEEALRIAEEFEASADSRL